ncbi:MAG: hypothetical protein HFJ91_04090 [Muribaculaceae bacterium]|nr:hypothetical protein [Muribaculaceae bacterium]
MSDYSYIHVALRGEVQGATRTIYSYPSNGSATDPDWNAATVEPGAAIKRFLNASECYVIQSTPVGHYLSLITRNPLAPDRGFMMISIMVDNGCALTGRQALNAFNTLKKALIEEEKYTDEAVDEALLAAGVPLHPVKLEAWTYNPDRKEPESEAGYRTYMSVQELESIFSFPGQPDYADYRCILVVSATTSLRPGVKMPRITAPIRKQYDIVCPEGVTASAPLVYDGDRITLTYSKEGFNTHTENVVAGTPAAYTKYEGSTIHVRTAAQTGIRFIRRIPVKVMSAKGTALNGYTISVNGRSISTMDPYIDFTEKDLTPGSEVDIQVASNNYRPLKLKQPAEQVLTTDELELTLQPVEQGVTLRLDFGDGRVFEQQISIEKSTPEYNRLHSGNFHGFRAHRQVTDNKDEEVYNVDVRITSRPVAPNFETSRQDHDTTTHTAPRFENVSDEAAERRPKIDHTLPERQRTPEPEEQEADDEDVEPIPNHMRRRFMTWGIGIAALAAVIIGLIIFLPQGDNGEGTVDNPATAELMADSAATTPVAPAAPMTPDEQADADYLNGNSVWDLERLKSPMGIALAKAITEGDLNALSTNDYFTVAGRCTNAQATEIVDMAWKAIGSPNEHGNARKLRGSVKKGSVNLRETVNSLAKVRPAEKINEQPRPRK